MTSLGDVLQPELNWKAGGGDRVVFEEGKGFTSVRKSFFLLFRCSKRSSEGIQNRKTWDVFINQRLSSLYGAPIALRALELHPGGLPSPEAFNAIETTAKRLLSSPSRTEQRDPPRLQISIPTDVIFIPPLTPTDFKKVNFGLIEDE